MYPKTFNFHIDWAACTGVESHPNFRHRQFDAVFATLADTHYIVTFAKEFKR